MQVPVELVVWIGSILLTGIGAFMSINIHLLIRILGNQATMQTKQLLLEQEIKQVKGEHLYAESVTRS